MLYCETPVARAANQGRQTRRDGGWQGKAREEDKERWKSQERERGEKEGGREGRNRERREKERVRGKRCSCSPSNCALRAVAGNERGTTEGTVHSILFLPLLSFFVFSSCFICYLGLFTLRQSLSPSLLFFLFFFFFLFFSVSLSRRRSPSHSFCLRYLARVQSSPRRSLIR